jgi:predicted TIM-barrel fold metal-dependent hydrolase
MHYRSISADNHFNEPGDVYVRHLPASMRDQAPRLVPTPDGGEAWSWEGSQPKTGMSSTYSLAWLQGRRWKPEEYRRFPIRHADTARGSWDPKTAIEEMEKDSVDASVWYPGLATSMYGTKDRDLRIALIRAYNDWQCEFCSYDPNRLLALAVMPTEEETPAEAIEELHRAIKLGFRGVLVPMFPKRRFWDAWWTPFFAAAEEAGMPVHFHKGVGPTADTGAFGDRAGPGMVSAGQIQSDFMYSMPIADFIFGGVFDRHPALKVISGEGRIGWLAHFAERGDVSYARHRFLQKLELKLLPSEYLRRNVWNTFLEDRTGILMRELIGVDNQMWSSDYPHGDTTWPYSAELNAKQFRGIPEADARKMLTVNAAKLYKLPSDELGNT